MRYSSCLKDLYTVINEQYGIVLMKWESECVSSFSSNDFTIFKSSEVEINAFFTSLLSVNKAASGSWKYSLKTTFSSLIAWNIFFFLPESLRPSYPARVCTSVSYRYERAAAFLPSSSAKPFLTPIVWSCLYTPLKKRTISREFVATTKYVVLPLTRPAAHLFRRQNLKKGLLWIRSCFLQ